MPRWLPITLISFALGLAAGAFLLRIPAQRKTTHPAANPAPNAPEVTPLMDGDYFPAIHEALQDARRSILCIMYRANYSPGKPHYRETMLIEDLVAARARGVAVEAVFDANKTYWEKDAGRQDEIEPKNEEAIARLRAARVPVFVDDLDLVTHAKIVVIDEELVFLGSTNWTGAALRQNHEANVQIRSKDVAARFLAPLRKIKRQPTQ